MHVFFAHRAIQWLARLAYGYIEPVPDDEHANLGWNDEISGFETYPLIGDISFGVNIKELELVCLEGIKKINGLSLDGGSDVDVNAWLAGELALIGLNPAKLGDALPYDLPTEVTALPDLYKLDGISTALDELANWFSGAAELLAAVQQEQVEPAHTSSPLRCWPHHFDLATLLTVSVSDSSDSGTIGIGISPGDNYYNEPYFYASPNPQPDIDNLPTLPELGSWHTEDFVGVVAPAHRIITASNPLEETLDFLRSATLIGKQVITS
ncbi:MAG: hypothetical protein HN731_16425 [Rhodospirillaceae bacterium]|nr:hypothetical protein [Rhodospirillaceae bacterium]MBT7956782.1 hypothetical protein [Rhodospirillaceae bacterium]